jgi:imidazoleglycerol-phosphate dehydratase
MRRAKIARKTAETEISVEINLDGTGAYDNRTGVGFFDHMLDQLARHALIDLTIAATGDLHIDDHHTVEDVGITLGQALAEALGDKRGIRRYGAFTLVMDEARVDAALDLSARPFLVWDVDFPTPKIGTFDTELVREFFQALSTHGGITLHVTKRRASTATTSPRPRSNPSRAPARGGGTRPAPRRCDPVDQPRARSG